MLNFPALTHLIHGNQICSLASFYFTILDVIIDMNIKLQYSGKWHHVVSYIGVNLSKEPATTRTLEAIYQTPWCYIPPDCTLNHYICFQ
jgi:hypothetical protein